MTAAAGSPPTAVLFDFGGVLTTSPFESFARYERSQGLPEGLIRQLNATNPDANAWSLLERGMVDVDIFARLFEAEAAEHGHELDGHAVLECLDGELRPRMVTAVGQLAASFRLGLLTNNFQTVDGAEGPWADLVDHFDTIVESSAAGCRKPEPRFYEIALERLDIGASEAVFLDDLGINLKPARAMGMTTIKVVDADEALDQLGQLVGMDLG